MKPRTFGDAKRRLENFHALGLILPGNSAKMSVALPMLTMETEMKTQRSTSRGRGFTLTELLVVICVLAALVLVLFRELVPQPRDIRRVQRINCVNNLKQIGLAFRIWDGDNGDRYQIGRAHV